MKFIKNLKTSQHGDAETRRKNGEKLNAQVDFFDFLRVSALKGF
jgi:hypothetical protein